MSKHMPVFQVNPVKLYIQDIYRAERSLENKYIFQLFGISFKNIVIHGVVTSVYNVLQHTMNMEITDPTGSIQVYYDSTKSNKTVSEKTYKNLKRGLNNALGSCYNKLSILRTLTNSVTSKKDAVMDIEEGDYVRITGDIFLDVFTNNRMVSVFDCVKSSAFNDILWLEELKYLYDNYYVKNVD